MLILSIGLAGGIVMLGYLRGIFAHKDPQFVPFFKAMQWIIGIVGGLVLMAQLLQIMLSALRA